MGGKAPTKTESDGGETAKKQKKIKGANAVATTLYKQHITTHAASSGLGKRAAAVPGRLAAEKLWDFLPSPKWLAQLPRTKLPPGGHTAAAAVELECTRAQKLNRLRQRLQELCAGKGLDIVPKLAFEKWRFAAKFEEERAAFSAHSAEKAVGKGGKGKKPKGAMQAHLDPLIPGLQQSNSPDKQRPEPGLVADLVRAGMETADAEETALELARESKAAAREVAALGHKLASGRAPMEESQLPVLSGHNHSLDMQCRGHFVKLTFSAFEKLQLLYGRHAPLADGDGQEPVQAPAPGAHCSPSTFSSRAFALLLRYKTIQGHGFQAAAGPKVFELLSKRLGVALECFASPLNTFLGRFCSAFPDVDSSFGSQGSFWSFGPDSGSFQANPPFVPAIMDAMASRLQELLLAAQGKAAPLSFVVFIPGWEECECWKILKKSQFLRGELLIAANDHGYCDGASHQRNDSFRISCYDSGVFVLQTDAASRKWPVSDDLLSDLRLAMAMATPTEAASKRHKRSK